ncbi:MAG: cadherin domain-containing protein, partial [Pseudonocardiaceae bacterium]
TDVTFNPGSGAVIIGSFSGGGAGGGNLVVTFNATAGNAAVSALLHNVTYLNSNTTNPTAANRTVRFVLSDGDGGTSLDSDATITIALNTPPELTAGATLNFSEGDPATVIDATVTVSDADSVNLTGATVQITGNYQNGADVLSFAGSPPISGSFDGPSGTLTLSGTDTLANYHSALRNVMYLNNSNNPITAARTVTWIGSDGTDASLPVTSTITVAATNDGPVIAAGGTLAYTEGGPATAIDLLLTVTDPDSLNLTGATIQITANYENGADVLSFANSPPISGSFDVPSGTLTLSDADTVANYETALRTVRYQNTSGGPSPAPRTVSWNATDGITPSNTATSTITVSLINDPPQPTGGPFSIAENSANGSPVGTVAANDPDVGQTHTFNITGGNAGNAFTIDPGTGAITVNNSAALDFETTPSFGLTVEVTDNDTSPLSSNTTVTINLSDANDPPVVTPATFALPENSANGTI